MVNSFNVFLKHFLRAFCLDPSPFYNWVICFLDSVFACLFWFCLHISVRCLACQDSLLPVSFFFTCWIVSLAVQEFLSFARLTNWYSHSGNQYEEFFKNLKINLPYDQAIPLRGTREKYSTFYSMDTCSAVFFAALFTITRKCKRSKCPPANERLMKL